MIYGVSAAAAFLLTLPTSSVRAEAPCINVYHDESGASTADNAGPMNAIMLANLLGHWPQYEIRVRPIFGYQSADLTACKSTIYLGTDADSEVPEAFLRDFFASEKRIAWVGFGQQMLDKSAFKALFKHKVAGQVDLEPGEGSSPRFYQHVLYKERLFKKSVEWVDGKPEGAFNAVRFAPTANDADSVVLAKLIHNASFKTTPYFLRAGTKFVVGDIPFAYMHEADRYFAFADLLFDILDEPPLRTAALAFARTEDIHALYELHLLKAVVSAHRSEGVPFSMAHIPLFSDPFNAFGGGDFKTPFPATEKSEFVAFIKDIAADPKNTIVWHGVTHQFGEMKNPHSGTSGDDYEFWNMVANKPIGDDGVQWTLDRLSQALPVFEAYNRPPRFWVTPHYHASALDSRVFASVFPWQIGRVTYYPSSFSPSFTINRTDRAHSTTMPSVTKESLNASASLSTAGMDFKSEGGLTQMFPFEIYRDVYGQRILPETLGYMSYATSDQTAFVRTADDMLADARRNSVVRDYWASFFYHPYVFSQKEDGGIGQFDGDTMELRKLLIGLKLLGYTFTSLPDFEASLSPQSQLGSASDSSSVAQ
jgi:uncharacterized protein YdaL